MKRVDPVRGNRTLGLSEQGDPVNACECFVVKRRVSAVLRDDAVDVGEVREPERRGEVVHVHLKTVLRDVRLEPKIFPLVVALIAVYPVPSK